MGPVEIFSHPTPMSPCEIKYEYIFSSSIVTILLHHFVKLNTNTFFRVGVILISSFKLLESGSTSCLHLNFLNVKSQRVSSSKQNGARQNGVFFSKPADVFAATSLLGLKQDLAATSTNTETPIVMEIGKHQGRSQHGPRGGNCPPNLGRCPPNRVLPRSQS